MADATTATLTSLGAAITLVMAKICNRNNAIKQFNNKLCGMKLNWKMYFINYHTQRFCITIPSVTLAYIGQHIRWYDTSVITWEYWPLIYQLGCNLHQEKLCDIYYICRFTDVNQHIFLLFYYCWEQGLAVSTFIDKQIHTVCLVGDPFKISQAVKEDYQQQQFWGTHFLLLLSC